jgi:hypothetical protein
LKIIQANHLKLLKNKTNLLMRNLYTLILMTVFSVFCNSQIPQGISYQAIAQNNFGLPVINTAIGIKIDILNDSATGTILYSETHSKTTSLLGLYNLVIGQGATTLGNFANINWANGLKFFSISIDLSGGSNYTLVGTTQLLSVPYALCAGKVKKEDVVGITDDSSIFGDSFTTTFITATNAYIFAPLLVPNYSPGSVNPTAVWQSIPIQGVPFMKARNSFLTTTNAYIFSQSDTNDTQNWYSFPISGNPIKISSRYQSVFAITATNAYAYGGFGANSWVNTPLSGEYLDSSIDVNTCGIMTTTHGYAYIPSLNISNAGSWSIIPLTGTPLKIKYTRAGIMILTSTFAYHFTTSYSSATTSYNGIWKEIALTSPILID